MRFFLPLAIALWCGLSPSALADADIACPGQLRVMAAAADVPGWQAVDRARAGLPLERIAIRRSPDGGEEIPQTGFLRMEQGMRKTILARWDLAEARSVHADLWLTCFYAGTTIALTRPLPAEARACEYRVESTDTQLEETTSCR